MGKYLDTKPVHCILLVCQASCPRVDNNTKGLLNILATKIAPKDYAKLGVVVNVYNHNDQARQSRSYNSQPRGQGEAEIQEGIKEQFAQSLRGKDWLLTGQLICGQIMTCLLQILLANDDLFGADFAVKGKLAMSEKHIVSFVSHTFFVDSHYTPFASPEDNHEAFVGLSNWARTCGEIDRADMTDDMAAVNEVSFDSVETLSALVSSASDTVVSQFASESSIPSMHASGVAESHQREGCSTAESEGERSQSFEGNFGLRELQQLLSAAASACKSVEQNQKIQDCFLSAFADHSCNRNPSYGLISLFLY